MTTIKSKAFKIAFLIFIVLFVIITSGFIAGYFHFKNAYHNEVLNKLKYTTQTVSSILDGDKYEELIKNNNVDGNEKYNALIKNIQKAHHELPELRYVYTTYFDKNNTVYFGLDTAPKIDTDNDGTVDHSFLGTTYDEAPESMKQAYKENKQITTQEPYSDKWGTFIASFKPIINSKGEVIGVFAIEMLYTKYKDQLNSIFQYTIIIYFVIMIIVFLLCYYIFKLETTHLIQFQKDIDYKKDMENKDKLLYQEARLAEIGKIMGSITHEINNPLMTISLCADLGKQLIEIPNNEDKIKNNFIKIENSVKKIANIIKTTKNLLRDGSNDEFENVLTSNLIQESLDILEFKLKSKPEIKMEIENSNLVIQKIPMQQVLVNLISNSIDAIEEYPETWIKIKGFIEQKNYVFEIIDSGKGIPKEVQDKINNGYFTTKKNGTGMGLLLSKKVIQSHKGNLTYVPMENTCFRITIPIT